MATTPSPPPTISIHTPPTPKHGYSDLWEPFSPRKSPRIAAAAAAAAAASSASSSAARTPSPASTPRREMHHHHPGQGPNHHGLHSLHRTQPHSPRPSKTLFHGSALSPEQTPRKTRKAPAAMEGLFLSASSRSSKAAAARASQANMGMLPTPAKTPSKKTHAASQNESNIAAIARNLFHTDVDEVMASPSRKNSSGGGRKKYTGFSLESFAEIVDDEPIPIFTDSQDRVPEVDNSRENPFFGEGAASLPEQTPRRRSKRNYVSIPGEGTISVDEASQREDGLVYVFRGKKIFRKFVDVPTDGSRNGSPERAAPGKRVTRSAVRPRLLFPRSERAAAKAGPAQVAPETTTDDEEAVTDIEETDDEDAQTEIDEAEPSVETEAETAANGPNGPSTPRATSEPFIGRVTRASKKRSPFQDWRQTKGATPVTAGQKRTLDAASNASVPAKRTRA